MCAHCSYHDRLCAPGEADLIPQDGISQQSITQTRFHLPRAPIIDTLRVNFNPTIIIDPLRVNFNISLNIIRLEN